MSGDTKISTPQNWQPPNQGQFGQEYQDLTNSLYNQITAGQTPGQKLSPYAVTAGTNAATNPYGTLATQGALNYVTPGANLAASAIAGNQALQGGANQILSTGFDPQQALFNQQQNQVLQQAAAANAMAGIQSSPYGASTAGNTLANFDLNWQNNQLGRQAQALGAATSAIPTGITAGTQGINTGISTSAQPYSSYNTIQANTINDLAAAIQAANLQYTLPQSTLSDLMSYLNLGQSASAEQSQINAQNLANTQSIFGGIGNFVGSLNPLSWFGGSGGGGADYGGGGDYAAA